MKANELMKGDKVAVRSNDGCDLHVMTVSEVKEEGISSGKHLVFFAYDEIEPIPITTEILEKNSFQRPEEERGFSEPFIVYVNDDYRLSIKIYPKGRIDRYHHLYIGIGDYGDDPFISLYINYVHELQHALRLCGLNKLANNFKVE